MTVYDDNILIELYNNKLVNNFTWDIIADEYNNRTGDCKTAEAIRKKVYRLIDNAVFSDVSIEDIVPQEKFKKIIASDERTEINAIYRRLTREQTILDIAKNAAQEIASNKPFKPTIKSDKNIDPPTFTGTLLISDWHYGMNIDNPFNKYNEDIFKDRLNNLLTGAIDCIKLYHLNEINVFNLGDTIAGRIHNTIRIQNRIDVISQIIAVSEYIADLLYELSKHVGYIHYYDCLDNHSRLEPNLKDSLDLESLVRITHWFLVERFRNTSNIFIHENEYGENIITTQACGYNIIAVHGHNDSPAKVIEDLSLMTRRSYDLVCTAHFHHFQADERNDCLLISNPSMMGTDEFAEKLRLSSRPAQIFIVHSPRNVIESIHRILV